MSDSLVRDLAAENARLRHLLETSPSTVYSLRVQDGRLVVDWVSQNVVRVLGYTPEETSAPGFWAARVHPGDRDAATDAISALFREGEVILEYRFRHRDGSYRHLRDGLTLVRDGEGRPKEVIGSWADITERVLMEEALRQSEDRFRRAFENGPVGMAVVGLDERFFQVNQALCEILGRTSEELLACTVRDVTHPDDLDAEQSKKGRMLRGDGTAFQMEKRYLHADGHVVWGQLSVSVVPDADGRPLYFIGQLEDVTERKRAEATLRESEERFRSLIEKTTDILTVFDAQGTIRFASPSLGEALGRPLEEIVGRTMLEFVHPEDLERTRRRFEEMLADPGATVRHTARVGAGDGRWRIFDSVGRSLFHVPAVGGLVVNSRDVTEQRALEDQFHQAQRLEAVGRLAGGVAHDFNNLLTVILGCAERLERSEARSESDRVSIREIRRAGERARDLTRRLLAFARREIIAPRAVDLNDLVRDAERLLRRLIGEDVELTTRLADGLWPVKADPGQIEQVILNLAVNARDAMPRGGRLVLETGNADLDGAAAASHPGAAAGPHVRLEIADTGTGIPAEILPHVFEPFFTTKPEGQGTGLGLATVYGIVTQSGGHVRIRTEPGRGTTVEMLFPRTFEVPRVDAGAAPGPVRGGHETILVIEDDPSVRDIASLTLEASGYRVLQAQNGRAALDLAAGHRDRIDLILTDVVMPGMSGPEAVAEIVRVRPASRVLYVSGHADETISRQRVLDPGVEFLPKPFTASTLLARIRKVLDGR